MQCLVCPLCSKPLALNPQGVSCSNRHQYDRAKEGYFNLLPVQHKHSREPGDAKQQLQARHAFLKAGFFSPLLQGLVQLLPADTKTLLDIGCGEGYFTQAMSEHCSNASVYGIDIAKAGVRLAAKNTDNITYAVASSYALPIASQSIDVITRIYAPSKDSELSRVLAAHGRLIIISPGENHLIALRQRIYRQLRPHPKPQVPAGFAELSQQQLSFNMLVPAGEYTQALLQMTPFAWQIKPELLTQLVTEGLHDTADFQLSVYNVT